jgi:hypothetical protein
MTTSIAESTALASQTSGTTTATALPATSSTSTESSELSSAAKAGIAAGCIILTLAAVASFAAGLLLWRRKQTDHDVTEMTPYNPFSDDKATLSGEDIPIPPRSLLRRTLTQMSELSAESPLSELGSGTRPPKLAPLVFTAELEGSPVTPVTENRPKGRGSWL